MINKPNNTILIVDDIPTNIEVLLDVLIGAGFEVMVALDGESALEQVDYAPPNMILLDVMMPGIDGFETCQHLKENPDTKDIPIIFMTALSETVDKIKGFEAGAVDYITKPFQHEEVLARVNTHLTMQQLQHKLQSQNDALFALNERLQKELSIAHQVQQHLLPPPTPDWVGLDVQCYNKPAREVGGDFYAYHAFAPAVDSGSAGSDSSPDRPDRRNCFAITVGDVSGKGMPAALLMSIGLASFQNTIPHSPAPGELLRQLNHLLQPYTSSTKQNCALVYVQLEPNKTDEWLMTVANAGCIVPLIRYADDSIQWADVGGLPLGIGTDFVYVEKTLDLAKGDMIFLISDGVVEANTTKGDMLGFEGFEQAVMSGPTSSAQEMLSHLLTEISVFVGQADSHDDLTIVVIKL